MNLKKISITTLASAAAVMSFGLPANAQTDSDDDDGNYPPATTVAPNPTTELPATGADDNGTLMLIAASLLGVGGVMVVASRSRQTA